MDKNVRHLAAAGHIWLGMLIIGAADNAMLLLTPETSLWVFHLIRSALVLAALIFLAYVRGWPLRPKSWVRVTARNFFSGVSMFLYFGSLAFVPIGVAIAGMFTAPVWVLLFSALFRAERVGAVRWSAVLVGFAGAILVIQPGDGIVGWSTVVPVIAGVFYAVGLLATRSWCEGEGTAVLMFSYYLLIGVAGLAGVVWLANWPVPAPDGAAGFVARGWVAPNGTVWFWLVVQALASIVGVGLLTRGYQIGEATYVTINEYALLIFASTIAWIVWGQALGIGALAGMAMIVGAGVVIALRGR